MSDEPLASDVRGTWPSNNKIVIALAFAAIAAVQRPTIDGATLAVTCTQAKLDRIAFYTRLVKIADSAHTNHPMTDSKVQELLGKPDDVLSGKESGWTSVEKAWSYGVDRHLGLATLGAVYFENHRVSFVVGASLRPPALSRISDDELQLHLRRLFPVKDDTLWRIRVGNDLIGLGADKALAVAQEFRRVDFARQDDGIHISCVLRAIFLPRNGEKALPQMPFIQSPFKKEPSISPRYPVAVIDDVPFVIGEYGPFDAADPLGDTIHQMTGLGIRSSPLRPPDDPFLAYKDLMNSPQWLYHGQREPRFTVPYTEKDGYMLKQVLQIVRDAYVPHYEGDPDYINGLDADRYHAEFLKLGIRWDTEKQAYVPGGSF